MNKHKQQRFSRTQTALAVGVALYTITGVSNAAYESRDPAIGQADSVENFDGQNPVTISVLDNDGVTIEPTSLAISSSPTKGVVSKEGQNLVYTPNPGFSGTDSFTYDITETDWRASAGTFSKNLAGITSATPIADNYADPGVAGGQSPIHDGAFNQPPIGFWNETALSNGVVGKSYSVNSTSTSIPGCNTDDTNSPAINMEVAWNAERRGGSNSGNMLTITGATAPTPLDDDGIVLKVNSFGNNVLLNGSGVEDLGGTQITHDEWKFIATGKWVGLTPEEFQNMPVTILASTVNGKIWFVNGHTFSASVDYSQCALHTATVTVTISDGTNVPDPGNPDDLDEDKDGIPDRIEGSKDTDGDKIVDYLDLDSDNDSITDIIEAGGSDSNFDGQVDNPTDANGDGQDDNVKLDSPVDTDNDGIPNFQEVDSNGDGTMDIAGTSESAADADNDGMRDTIIDSNQDGLDDSLLGNEVKLTDSDADGTPDYAEEADNGSNGGDSSGGGGGGGTLSSLAAFGFMLYGIIGLRRRRHK